MSFTVAVKALDQQLSNTRAKINELEVALATLVRSNSSQQAHHEQALSNLRDVEAGLIDGIAALTADPAAEADEPVIAKRGPGRPRKT